MSCGRRWSQAFAVAIVHGRQAAELDWAQYDRLSSEDVWELYQEEVGGENNQRLILLGLQPNSYVVSRPGGELLCYGNLMGIWMVNGGFIFSDFSRHCGLVIALERWKLEKKRIRKRSGDGV